MPLAAKCSICARCDFPHREARGRGLMSAHPNAAEQLAMTVFPLSLKAFAILAIAALAGVAVALTRPKSIDSAVLGSEWQCHKPLS